MEAPSEKSIFLSALEIEGHAERQEYLETACAGDARLRADVEKLLAVHAREDNVLDVTPAPVDGLRDEFRSVYSDSEEGRETPIPAESPGTMIGPYKLMEQVGEGGFGHVFVAEQQSPVRRKVALKIIKPGMDSLEVLARFEAERQALAMMEHPNIAQVYDAGATDSGRPYFVMELVRGIAITDFCEQAEINTQQRLELFIDVCLAVQHAHQKGVIHRDLKPQNLLVTLHDGVPVVKVIDFGVAKAMEQPLTAQTIYTRLHQVIGTPLYMSPEQIELSGLDVDTRSDIYSLGVLLYELLTGATPFDRGRLREVSFDEMRRIICEEEPPLPSDRLTTQGKSAATVPVDRRARPASPSTIVRGDLDWIVMKSLEKDRRRRYETASEFAADVRRFLQDEPIDARPPSHLYRLGKFARRNRVFLTTASLVLTALVLGTTVSVWQAVRATHAGQEADRLRQEAVDSADNLKQANILLDESRANADEGRWATAYRQLTEAGELQPDHYPVWSGRANLLVRLGLWDQAAADYEKALKLGASPNHPGWWGVPQLCMLANRHNTARSSAEQMLRQSEERSDHVFQIMALRACLAEPDPTIDTDDLVDRAEGLYAEAPPDWKPGPTFGGFGAVTDPGVPPPDESSPRGFAPPDPPPSLPPMMGQGFAAPRGVCLYVVGLAHFRAGNFDQAASHLEQAGQSYPFSSDMTLPSPVLAMAHHCAGRANDAAAALEEAATTLDSWLDVMAQGSVESMPVPWVDFVEHLLLYREATNLITGASPEEDPRLAKLEERALSAIEAQ